MKIRFERISIGQVAAFILLCAIVVYFAQGALYTQGSVISVGALLLALGISACYAPLILLSRGKESFLWFALLLYIINLFGWLLTYDPFKPLNFGQFKVISLFFLPMLASYVLTAKGYLKEKHLVVFLYAMLPLVYLNFFMNKSTILEARTSSREDVVNNMAYAFAVLLPFVFLVKNRVMAALSLLIIVLMVIQGAKRGALIVTGLGSMVYIYYELFLSDKKNNIYSHLFILLAVLVVSYFAYAHIQSNEFLIGRLEAISEGGSGRDRIYKNLLLAWYNSDSLLVYLFGFGFAKTVEVSGSGHLAHNDWLELLINFGLVGVFLYLSLFLSLLKVAFNLKVQRYKYALICIISMWFLTTLFSMAYTSYTSVFYSILIGFLIVECKLEQENLC